MTPHSLTRVSMDSLAVVALLSTLVAAAAVLLLARRRSRGRDALVRERAYFERLFESMPLAVVLGDGAGRIQRVSREFTRLFGYTEAEAVGRSIDDLIVPRERMVEARDAGRLEPQGRKTIPVTVRHRKDGSPVDVSVHCALIGLGDGATAVYSIYQDVSDRVRAEHAVRESERMLGLFFSQSLDAFFFMMLDEPVRWDASVDKERVLDYAFGHHRITKVNEAMRQQYGATGDQLLGLTPADFYSHDLASGRAHWRNFFDAGRLHIETDERKLDGTPIRIEGDYICLYDDQARIAGHFGVQRDVTTRRQAEEDQRLSEEQLRELAKRLQEVREQERRRIAIEIHDRLGQALTGMKLDLAWLERRLPADDVTHQRAQGILTQVDGAIESVKRLAAELRPAVLDTLGLRAAIEWQAAEFRERTGVPCHLELPPAEPAIDEQRSTALFRVLQEALTNVARHAGARRVDIRLASEDGQVVLEVSDDGKGIGDRQTTGPRSLGIAGMRERVAACGGRLRLATRQPGGTVLEARVPAGPGAGAQAR